MRPSWSGRALQRKAQGEFQGTLTFDPISPFGNRQQLWGASSQLARSRFGKLETCHYRKTRLSKYVEQRLAAVRDRDGSLAVIVHGHLGINA